MPDMPGIQYLKIILEIPLTADAEKKDWTQTGYAISVQRNGYSIEVLNARRILNFEGKFVQSGSGSTTGPALKRPDLAGAVACCAGMLEGQTDLDAPAAVGLVACQTDLHSERSEFF